MASPPRTLTNNNINNNNNVTNFNNNNDVATPKRKTTAATPRPSSLLENDMRKKSQDSSCASVKSSKSPMRSRNGTGTFQKRKRKDVEGETAVTPTSDQQKALTVPESDQSSGDDSISPRRDSKMARFQGESTVQANVASSSPKFLRSQRSVNEEPTSSQNSHNSCSLTSQPDTRSQNSSQNLAGDLHTGCSQQFSSMNFDLNLGSLFQQNQIPEVNSENLNSSADYEHFSAPQSPQRSQITRTQFSTPISRNGADNSSHHAITAIQTIFASNESHDSPNIGDSGYDLENLSNMENSFRFSGIEPQISTFRLKEYKDMGHLGSGGSSIVYKAAPPTNHYELSAIKRFENPQETDLPATRKKRESHKTQAMDEIRNLEYLHSASHGSCFEIIKLLRYEEEDRHTFVQLELMDDSLEDLMNNTDTIKQKLLEVYDETLVNQAARNGNIGIRLDVIQSWTEQVLDGLMHCHENGIVHRDIKCGNLLIKYQDNEVKIADFGLSTNIEQKSDKKLYDLVGTMINCAPEMWLTQQLTGKFTQFSRTEISEKLSRFGKNLDDYIGYNHKVDIWAFGCVLVQLACGIPLYENKEQVMLNEILECQIHSCNYGINEAKEMLPDYLKNDVLYEPFVKFLECCLQHSPADRADANELCYHEFLGSEEMEPA